MFASSTRLNPQDTMDPLLEQMNSLLHTTPLHPHPVRRERRFSDTDRQRPASGPSQVRSDAFAVLSRDGTRWFPAPDEQALQIGGSTTNTKQSESVPEQSLEAHCCTGQQCAVLQVFKTTELLELVLSFLESKEVLQLRRINRHWNSIVHESPRLRLHFFTYGQWGRPGANFELLPVHIPGVEIENGKELYLGQWVRISMTPDAAKVISPRARLQRRVRSRSIFEGLRGGLGTRAKAEAASDAWPSDSKSTTNETSISFEDLYVTQPPLVSMQAFVVHANAEDSGSSMESPEVEKPACAKLSCNAGITLGFLAETAQSLLTSNQGPSNMRSVKVVFKGIMSFCAPEQAPRRRSTTKTVTSIGS